VFGLKELVGYLRMVVDGGRVGRCDLVEVNPLKDKDGKMVESGKKILRVLVGERIKI